MVVNHFIAIGKVFLATEALILIHRYFLTSQDNFEESHNNVACGFSHVALLLIIAVLRN